MATSTVVGTDNAHIGITTTPVAAIDIDAASALTTGIDTTTLLLDRTTTTLGIATGIVLAATHNDTIGTLLLDGRHIAGGAFHESDYSTIGYGIESGTWHKESRLAGLLIDHALPLDLHNAIGHHNGTGLIPCDHHLRGLGCLQQRLAHWEGLASGCHRLGQWLLVVHIIVIIIIILFIVLVVVIQQHQLAIACQAETTPCRQQLINVIIIVIIIGSGPLLLQLIIIVVVVVVLQLCIIELIIIIVIILLDNLETLHHSASIGTSTWHREEQIRMMQLLLLLAQLTLLQAWLCAERKREREWIIARWRRQL